MEVSNLEREGRQSVNQSSLSGAAWGVRVVEQGGEESVLVALVFGLGGILEEASVVHDDLLADFGRRATARLDSSLDDTHDD